MPFKPACPESTFGHKSENYFLSNLNFCSHKDQSILIGRNSGGASNPGHRIEGQTLIPLIECGPKPEGMLT